MEDDLNLFCKWKTTSIYFVNERRPQIFKIEDNFISFINGRNPQLICKWKTTSILFVNGLAMLA
jgi:hypothetical protein